MQADLWSMAFVFVLATFVGLQVIQNVSRLLHTPLMSLTNAISAIAVVGSIIIAGEQRTTFSTILGTIAVACASASSREASRRSDGASDVALIGRGV